MLKAFSRRHFGFRMLAALFATTLVFHGIAQAKEGHDHEEKGPHGGSLVELGDEEYHAEFVMDEKANTATVYLLDGKAKEAVAIDSPDVLVNLKLEKMPKQVRLKALPVKTDSKGKSSRFGVKDAELIKLLHQKGASAQLRVKIAGKSYSGKIDLDHDDHDEKKK